MKKKSGKRPYLIASNVIAVHSQHKKQVILSRNAIPSRNLLQELTGFDHTVWKPLFRETGTFQWIESISRRRAPPWTLKNACRAGWVHADQLSHLSQAVTKDSCCLAGAGSSTEVLVSTPVWRTWDNACSPHSCGLDGGQPIIAWFMMLTAGGAAQANDTYTKVIDLYECPPLFIYHNLTLGVCKVEPRKRRREEGSGGVGILGMKWENTVRKPGGRCSGKPPTPTI